MRSRELERTQFYVTNLDLQVKGISRITGIPNWSLLIGEEGIFLLKEEEVLLKESQIRGYKVKNHIIVMGKKKIYIYNKDKGKFRRVRNYKRYEPQIDEKSFLWRIDGELLYWKETRNGILFLSPNKPKSKKNRKNRN